MSQLDQLATEVLLGTERRAPGLPSLPEALSRLLDAACPADTSTETRVLRTAGVLAACAAAGYVPPASLRETLAVSAAERLQPVADAALGECLRQLLAAGPDALRAEACRLLAGTGACLPPRLLPRALSLGQKTPALRGALLQVLGQRGDWLARQDAGWAWAVGAQEEVLDPALWEHGTLDQRKLYLDKLRRRDAAAARTLLQNGFAQLDARERSALLEQLATGLTTADEDFLEALLADRSKEVRLLAGRLLSAVPGSRYVARMGARMAACLVQERKLFRQVLTLEAPTAFGADWKDDALEETRAKSETLGDRAWWLYQIARALPLAWWPQQTGMTPAELIKWLAGTDWSEAVLRAWGEAMQREAAADWAEAFLVAPPIKGFLFDVFAFIECLPLAQREQHWLRLIEAGGRRFAMGDLLMRLLQNLPHDTTLSADFVQRVLREVRKGLPSDASKYDYNLRKALPEFVCHIPATSLREAAEGWPMGRPDTEYFTETLAAVLAIVEQRRILHSTLTQRKPT
ncbi:MAG: DUF5691 domain-containing protein [Rhodocyclaceae bacterium]